jgi:hypothetical protein
MNCPLCTAETNVLYTTTTGRMCRECKTANYCPVCGGGRQGAELVICGPCEKLTQIEQYNLLMERVDNQIAEAKRAYQDAYRAGNDEDKWTYQQVIRNLEKLKAGFNKPVEKKE